MEPTHDSPGAGTTPAELVVQNGRLAGTRRALNSPLTLIGRAPGCDIRLNVDGVSQAHCVLVIVAVGVHLRDLQSKNSTLVNGERVSTCTLKGGDLLSIGPFQFQLRLAERPAEVRRDREKEAQGRALAEQEQRLQQRWLALDQQREQMEARLRQEKEALRIQAAAVAAQQAALSEEEARLQQRKTALAQQEAQLASHLDDKQRRLVEIQNQAREARNALQQERTAYEARVAQANQEIEQGKKELADGRKQLQRDRQRVLDLHKRLKRRWHRHWAAERAAMRRREEELRRARHRLDKEREQLRQQQAALAQAQLRFNGEVELGRRQLQANWKKLRQDQKQWLARRSRELAELHVRARELEECQADLLVAEQELLEQRRQLGTDRLVLEKEAEGLENRIRNYRRKIQDLEQEVGRLKSSLPADATAAAAEAGAAATDSPPAPADEPAGQSVPLPEPVAADWRDVLTNLETLAGELADQRRHLAEQCQRLARIQDDWQREHSAALAEIEQVGQKLAARENHVQSAEIRVRNQAAQLAQLRHQLEGWQARMAAREAAWDGERERLLAELQAREQVVDLRLKAITDLHQRWTQRRKKEIERLRSEQAALVKFRQQCAAQRDEWLRRAVELQQKQRALGERVLALEHYKEEYVQRSADPKATAERIEKVHQRWRGVFAAEEQALERARQALEAEAAALEQSFRQLQLHTSHSLAADADFTQKQTAWERERLLVEDELEQLRGRVQALQAQRTYFEQERTRLRNEVEHLARTLLEESDRPPQILSQAA